MPKYCVRYEAKARDDVDRSLPKNSDFPELQDEEVEEDVGTVDHDISHSLVGSVEAERTLEWRVDNLG